MSKKATTQLFNIVRFAVLGLVLSGVTSFLGVTHNLHLRTINTLFNLRGTQTFSDSSVVIVAIDDESMKSLPTKWPYPRTYFARMIHNLSLAGARLIIFDVEFTEPSLEHPEEDDSLAASVARAGNVILAGKVVLDASRRSTNNHFILKPVEPLLATRAPIGLVNVIEDGDGFIRQYLLFQQMADRYYFPLAVQAYLSLHSINQNNITPHLQHGTFTYGPLRLPTVSDNTMYVNFVGPAQTFRTYSLATILDDAEFNLVEDEDTDIFEQHLLWNTFRDKIVFVGASAEELQDNKYTPFFEYRGSRQKMPGVEMHANALYTLRHGLFLQNAPVWASFLLLGILALLTAAATLTIKPFRALTVTLLLIILSVGFGYLLFIKYRVIMNLVQPVLCISFTFVVGLAFQTVTEQREKARIRKTFQQYVSPSVVEKMLSGGDMPSYGGERRELTVLFSDIRRFTSFSESHEPEVVVNRLQEYLSEMVEVIFKYDGTLDKFVGDEIMALYGAPYYYADHAERACRTALDMTDNLRQIQKRWSADFKEYFNIGIGINSGKVIVGNLGSRQLFDYTVIGDQVNVGARLEGLNKYYETTIIISEQTYAHVRELACVRELDLVRVMGRTQPLRIYELRGFNSLPDIEQEFIVDIFGQGLQAYRERRWAEALRQFRRVLRYFPSDGPSRLYTVRCLNNLENPVPADWDGVYEMETK
jgi:adenylate cyclase